MNATRRATEQPGPPRPARADRERRLLIRARRGETDALDALVRSLSPLVQHIARGYARDADDLDDLVQVGHLGLTKALARFDLSRTSTLAAFVDPTVTGEIRRHLRDTTWRVHAPRPVRETAWRLPHAEDRLRSALGRDATELELAGELDVSVAAVAEARQARAANLRESLDLESDSQHGTSSMGAWLAADSDGGLERSLDCDRVRRAMAHLRRAERMVIGMAFLEERSQREIGLALGCSQMQVSRMLDRALDKLQHELRVA